jgi:hypothetical protein
METNKIYPIAFFSLIVLFSCKKGDNTTLLPPSINKNLTELRAEVKYNDEAIKYLESVLKTEKDKNIAAKLQNYIDEFTVNNENSNNLNTSKDSVIKIADLKFKDKSIKKLATDKIYYSPQEIEDLENYLIAIYGAKAKDVYASYRVQSGSVSISGFPNSSTGASVSLISDVLDLWGVKAKFTVSTSDLVNESFNNFGDVQAYADIESVSDVRSSISGLTSLLGLSFEWEHTMSSHENHGRIADVSVEGRLKTNGFGLISTTNDFQFGIPVLVSYMTPKEYEDYAY